MHTDSPSWPQYRGTAPQKQREHYFRCLRSPGMHGDRVCLWMRVSLWKEGVSWKGCDTWRQQSAVDVHRVQASELSRPLRRLASRTVLHFIPNDLGVKGNTFFPQPTKISWTEADCTFCGTLQLSVQDFRLRARVIEEFSLLGYYARLLVVCHWRFRTA